MSPTNGANDGHRASRPAEEQSLGRIGYLVRVFPKISETFVLNEILELERRGFELHLYSTYSRQEPIEHENIGRMRAGVTRLDLTLLRAPWTVLAAHARSLFRRPAEYVAMALRAAASRDEKTRLCFREAVLMARFIQRDDLRYLHAGFVNEPCTVAHGAHRLTGIPYSAAAHARDIYLATPADLRRKLAAAQFVVTCTDYNRRHLEQVIGCERLRRVHHGADLTQFRYGSNGFVDPPVVLSVARFVPKKGVDTLIEACAILRENGRQVDCHIVGSGTLEVELGDLVRSLGLERVVTFEGMLGQQAVCEWYRRATLFALPCRVSVDGDRDGLPNVLVEAAASGVPVVTTEVSGIPELVRHEETGLVVEPSSPRALAGAIERLLDDRDLRDRLRANARAVVEERFDLRRNADIIAREIHSAVTRSNAMRPQPKTTAPGGIRARART